MPYRIMSFDGVSLPDYNTVDDLGTGEIESPLVDALNGSIDYYGATRKLPRSQKIAFKGSYLSQNGRLTDGLGRLLVDGENHYLLPTAQFFNDLQQKTDAIKSKLGVLGRLYRQPEGARAAVVAKNEGLRAQIAKLYKAPTPDTNQINALLAQIVDPNSVGLQWKLARLLSVKYQRELKDIDRIATLDLEFQTTMSAWKSADLTVISNSANGSVDIDVTTHGSETVNDFMVKITPTSGALASVRILVNNATVVWDASSRAGSEDVPAHPLADPITVGRDLIIDMGKQIVTVGGKDGYANFDPPNSLPGWLYFTPGYNRVSIRPSGAAINYALSFYDQWT